MITPIIYIKPSHESGEIITIKVELFNNLNIDIYALKWTLPSIHLMNGIFKVINIKTTELIPYLGHFIQKDISSLEDFILIKSKQYYTFEVNLSKYYFISTEGKYSIQLNTVLYYSLAIPKIDMSKIDWEFEELISKQHIIHVTKGKDILLPPSLEKDIKLIENKENIDLFLYNPSFFIENFNFFKSKRYCKGDFFDDRETMEVQNSRTYAYEGVLKSLKALYLLRSQKNSKEGREVFKIYKKCFGNYGTKKIKIVIDNYILISKKLNSFTIVYGKGKKNYCQFDGYAYIKREGCPKIFLCKKFWEASLNEGFHTKYGILIHETSHLVSRYINDYAYKKPQIQLSNGEKIT